MKVKKMMNTATMTGINRTGISGDAIRLKESYFVTYDLKPSFFDEYRLHEDDELTKSELRALIENPRAIVYRAVRRTTAAD